MLTSPLVDIRTRLVDTTTALFTVESDTRAYWRIASLDLFDGRSAVLGRAPTRRRGASTPTPWLLALARDRRHPAVHHPAARRPYWFPAAYQPIDFNPTASCALRHRDDHPHRRRPTERGHHLRRHVGRSPTSPRTAALRRPEHPDGGRERLELPDDFSPTAERIAREVTAGRRHPLRPGPRPPGLLPQDGRVHLHHRRPPGQGDDAIEPSSRSASATASSSPAPSRPWPAASTSRPGSPSATRGAMQDPADPDITGCWAATPTPGPRSTSASTAGCRSSRRPAAATPTPRATPGWPASRTTAAPAASHHHRPRRRRDETTTTDRGRRRGRQRRPRRHRLGRRGSSTAPPRLRCSPSPPRALPLAVPGPLALRRRRRGPGHGSPTAQVGVACLGHRDLADAGVRARPDETHAELAARAGEPARHRRPPGQPRRRRGRRRLRARRRPPPRARRRSAADEVASRPSTPSAPPGRVRRFLDPRPLWDGRARATARADPPARPCAEHAAADARRRPTAGRPPSGSIGLEGYSSRALKPVLAAGCWCCPGRRAGRRPSSTGSSARSPPGRGVRGLRSTASADTNMIRKPPKDSRYDVPA